MTKSFWIHFLTECGNSGQTRIDAKNITLAIGVFYLRCPYQGARVIKAEEIISEPAAVYTKWSDNLPAESPHNFH